MTPKAVLGIPLYNGEAHLAEALECFLNQSCGDLAIVMVDDGSTDYTEEIARKYVAVDRRLSYERNPERLGMTRNWTHAFHRARALHGDVPFFAWGSDHDVWHPRWLAALLTELEDPGVVAAYPLNVGISDEGVVIQEPWTFETRGLTVRRERFDSAIFGMSAGNMVYALYRSAALARAEVYRTVVLPDRLLLAELALYGEFRQVREILWHRRYRLGVTASLARQRASFYLGATPWWSYAPWPVVHTLFLGRSLVLRGNGSPEVGRAMGILYTVRYFCVSSVYNVRIRWRKSKKRHRLVKALRAHRNRIVRFPRRIARKILGPLRQRRAVSGGR